MKLDYWAVNRAYEFESLKKTCFNHNKWLHMFAILPTSSEFLRKQYVNETIMTTSNFQSYLIVSRSDPREKTLEILKSKGLPKIKVSPDIFIISPLKTSISIDEVRNLKKHIFQKPVSLPYKYIIIEEAHKLTLEAQNALLKILEEPPSSTILILEAENKYSLLPTILSRVVLIDKEKPKKGPANTKSILDFQSEVDFLLEVSNIKNPKEWLDNQMIMLTEKLEVEVKLSKNRAEVKRIAKIIRLCANAKKMISSNINPRFALANLIFNIS